MNTPRLFALLTGILVTISTVTTAQEARPRLLADKSDIERAREWIATTPWYRTIVEVHRRECETFIRRRPIFVSPIKQTYEYKMYTCPKHDVELLYEELRPSDHRCRVDTTEVYRGGKYDAAWAGWYNRVLASRLVWLGILYQLYGEDRYAEAGREILLKFADLYLQYPTSNTILGPAHVFFGTLSESFWGVDMAYGYDLLYTYPGFTEADRKKLKDDLFYPLAVITQQFPESASNRQLWYNNVSAAVGFLYNDQNLIDFALKGKYGFYWQLGSATPESGFWAEWSGYHFVALRGMIHLAEMARHNGLDLYHVEIAGRSMKKMFDAPFHLVLPNYEFPRLKDSGGGNIMEYAVFYEVGYAVYRDPKYLALLNKTSVMRGTQVVGETSALGEANAPVTMFNLEPNLPKSSEDFIPLSSVNMEGNGFAMLRNGVGPDRRAVYLDYGIMGGEHGHPDRLQIGYYAGGRNWIVDPLNESYFNPNLQLWYRQTIAHATPVLDQTSQTWTNGGGSFFGSLNLFQVASGFSETTYPGSKVTRTVIQAGDYFIDLVDLESPDRRTIDWPLQSFGTLELKNVSLTAEPRDVFGHEPGIPGYDQLMDVRSERTGMGWSGIFTDKEGHMLVKGIGEKGTTVYQATAPSIGGFYKQMVAEHRPMAMVMSRRLADKTRFAHLIQVFDTNPTVIDFRKLNELGSYEITREGSRELISANVPESRYWFVRQAADVPVGAAGFNISEIRIDNTLLVSSETRLSEFECRWDGSRLDITVRPQFVRMKIYGPDISTVQVNGVEANAVKDGEYVLVSQHQNPCFEVVAPTDSALFVGMKNRIAVRVWNPTTHPLRGSLRLGLSKDWNERVVSQLQWWGGVVNLLPLHKGTVHRTLVPERYREDAGWIDGKSSGVIEISPGSSKVIEIPLQVPNDAPPVDFRALLIFGADTLQKTFKVTQPVEAHLVMPNGKEPQLLLKLKNRTPGQIALAARIAPHSLWKTKGPLTRTVTLAPKATGSVTFPVSLSGYSADNQHYPVQVGLEAGGFSFRFERDIYAGIATYADQAPSLDGSWKGWNRTNPVTIDKITQVHKLLLGNQPWGGKTDLSARVYAMYDDRFLYVGAEVSDQTNVTTWNFPAMSYPWDTDCMEVVLDLRTGADQGSDPPTPGLKRHLSLAEYRKTEFEQDRWRGFGAGGPTLPKPLLVPNAETYYSRTGSGYTLICRYPLASLPAGVAGPGKKIGFDVAINDNDGTTYRKNVHIWAGYTANQTWWSMETIGALIFGPKK